MSVSFDAKFCASKSEASPTVVWVWDMVEMSLNSVCVQNSEVTGITFCPDSHNLNISCAGQSKLYLWSPKGASVC